MEGTGKVLRCLRRCFWVLAIAAVALLHFAALRLRRRPTLRERALWLQQYCRHLLPKLGVTYEVGGDVPASGLIVSNHLSYLDILVFSAATGCSFVSKAEVRSWPLFGPFARLSGTVFVWRHSAVDSVRAYEELTECLKAGHPVTLFPEATTSDSMKVLPFRSTMFQAAIEAGVPVTVAAISYELADGDVATDICFWGDMRPVPHALKMFTKRRIECRVRFGPVLAGRERKEMAREAWEWVVAEVGRGQSAVVSEVATSS